jgi:O-antigen/teichoic acid export membrane protein
VSETDYELPPSEGAPHVLSSADVGRRVVRGSAVRLVGFGVINILGAAGVVLLQRTLGVDDYGRYGTVLALVAIVGLVTDAGLTITGTRELALRKPGSDRRALLGTVLGVRIALTAVGVVGCLCFALAAGYPGAMVAGVALAGAGAVLLSGQSALALPFAVDLRNVQLTFTELAKQLILLAGIVALAVIGAGLVPFLGVQLAVGAGALALTYLLLDRSDRSLPRFTFSAARELARHALPVAAASVLAMAYVRILVVLASLLTSERETGLVVASARIVEIAGGLPLLLAGVVLPVAAVAARDDRVRLGYVVAKTTEVALLVGAVVAVALALAAHPLVIVLGGNAFADAAPVLQIHAAAVASFFVIQAWNAMLIADGRQRVVVRSSLVGLVTVLVAGLVLIPLYDARGAATAAIIADVANAAGLLIGVRAISGRRWPTPLSFLIRFVMLVSAAVAIGVLLPLPAIFDALIATAILTLGALALRLVPSEVLDAIPRRRPG